MPHKKTTPAQLNRRHHPLSQAHRIAAALHTAAAHHHRQAAFNLDYAREHEAHLHGLEALAQSEQARVHTAQTLAVVSQADTNAALLRPVTDHINP